MAAIFIWMSLLFLSTEAAYIVGDIVNTTSGRVQGRPSELRPFVSTYQNIPYAKPPYGDLRFEAPVPVEYSNVTIQATAFVGLLLSFAC